MKQLRKLHMALLLVAAVAALTWGTEALLAFGSVLLAIQLLMWRADLVRVGGLRRSWQRDRSGAASPDPPHAPVRHAIHMGAHSRREFDFGMRRRLEHVASTRLADRHGIDLRRDPAAARALLGDEAWDLLDPRRPVSDERSRDGVSIAALNRVIDRLEHM